MLVNEENRKYFNSKGFAILDFYFNQISQIVWPRFVELFEIH